MVVRAEARGVDDMDVIYSKSELRMVVVGEKRAWRHKWSALQWSRGGTVGKLLYLERRLGGSH